ncbi:MAG TPA: hypothetical protein VNA28_05990 [Solirubrobacteraceae bacterium]|nr:hypothetical protein [Solirubrobacteraceae bacterium]
MSQSRSVFAPLAVVVLVAIAFVLFARGAPAGGGVGESASSTGARYALKGGGSHALPAPAPLRFAPGIAVSDQQIVLRAASEARPEARRVVELVTAMVTVRLGAIASGVAGQTRATDAGYDVVLDLGGVYRGAGMRGVRRLVLHELAHVVDHALVGANLEAQLDAATPPGFGCDDGTSGGCAAREERFAESFAKWATGDIGHDLYIGYRVPPPTSLSGWGAPLAALAR